MRDVDDWSSWEQHPDNIYCGRYNPSLANHGFGNPYSVRTYGRQLAVKLYVENIVPTITNDQLSILRKKRVFGCWCAQNELCHTDSLINLLS